MHWSSDYRPALKSNERENANKNAKEADVRFFAELTRATIESARVYPGFFMSPCFHLKY
ncbi:MAG: hypothetical protein U9N87_10050 [Planctomycetota bacterium]|nr:hypothetical protein [Planctomycetota bacterium]